MISKIILISLIVALSALLQADALLASSYSSGDLLKCPGHPQVYVLGITEDFSIDGVYWRSPDSLYGDEIYLIPNEEE